MLKIQNLSIEIDNQKILQNISLSFELGMNYCILGKNGSGKSSLALSIMGHPSYIIKTGDMLIDGVSLLSLSPNERAKKGVFLAFQSIPEIKGIKLFEFLRTIYSESIGNNISFLKFKDIIKPLMEELSLDTEFLRRDLNVGFSGGEKRKLEVLQIRLLNPKYIFLDEIDSGLDVDAFREVADLLKSVDTKKNCFVVITHLFGILEYLSIDQVFVMQNGKIKEEGSKALAMKIQKEGFGEQI